MFKWENLVGDRILQKGSLGLDTAETGKMLNGKYVGLYFSAHWCGPCRWFTPQLMKCYRTLRDNKDFEFEIVFVSMDKTSDQFEEYFGGMPWAAIPFTEQRIRSDIARKFHVNGIPSLVVLAPDGDLINSNARTAVMKDLEGKLFPWNGMDEKDDTMQHLFIWIFVFIVGFLFYYFVLQK
eukprot:TRINITY_DN10556_c2_g1_i10.p2 TRINITY_DN10556_c2_g1~~TRINITY_DN10556_c2_g1_i10.p2  ORF type:complete len:192 (-),score=13.46 TRINITY_DN10556_c2_g1_i10:684-1223(-)